MIATATPAEQKTARDDYSTTRLALGVLGRMWLWFVATCLAVTIIPALFGWNSYVIFSGSMAPKISEGDVVLSSPNPDFSMVDGRVITFNSPSDPGAILTHRVRSVNDDGTLVTRGDASPSNDPLPVHPDDVTGLGRLLVRYVGLPAVWARNGSMVPLGLFLGSLAGAAFLMLRDREPDEDEEEYSDTPARVGSSMTLILVLALALVPPSSASFTSHSANLANSWMMAVKTYTQHVLDLGPYLYWKFSETSGTNVADSSGSPLVAGNIGGTFTRNAFGPIPSDSVNRSIKLDSTTACVNTASGAGVAAPSVFTLIAWFRAESTYNLGGKLIGFERPQTGVAAPTTGAYDRMLYMDGAGNVRFAVYSPGYSPDPHVTISSGPLNNGQWRMVVGTMSSAGMRLYVDGSLVVSHANTVAEDQNGWWRAGCGNLAGWGNHWTGDNNPTTSTNPTQNRTFQRDLDEITVFSGQALTAAQIQELWNSR